jgi:DNA polymerase-3 subunit delta
VVKRLKDLDEESRRTLGTYLARPLNYIYLVIFLDKEEDRNKWSSLSPKACLVEFKKFYEGDTVAWLTRRAKANNQSLSREVAGLFLECLGPDLALLSQGLERVIDYIGPKGVIEAKDVEAVLESERKDIVFDLTAAMAAQDRPRCLKILNKLFLDLTPPQQIITRLAWQVRQLYTLKKGGDLKIPPFYLKRLREEAQRFTLEKLEECLYRLREVDRAIKNGEREPRLSLELFFFRFFS